MAGGQGARLGASQPKALVPLAGTPLLEHAPARALAAPEVALRPDDVIVLVHDAARALAPAALFTRLISEVGRGFPAVVPGLLVTDTIKQVDGNGRVLGTPDRASLRAIQTPQAFQRSVLEQAHATAGEATDDAALVERVGTEVRVVDGDPLAFKITTSDDLAKAERHLAD